MYYSSCYINYDNEIYAIYICDGKKLSDTHFHAVKYLFMADNNGWKQHGNGAILTVGQKDLSQSLNQAIQKIIQTIFTHGIAKAVKIYNLEE